MRRELKGLGAAPGAGLGKAYLVDARLVFPPRRITAHNAKSEVERFERAISLAQKEFGTLTKDRRRIGAEAGELVDFEKWILEDRALNNAVAERIKKERLSAFWAYWEETEKTSKALEASQNSYIHDRSSDLRGVVRHVLNLLSPESSHPPALPERAILVARHLSPMDLFRYPAERLGGIVLAEGGTTSHLVLCAASIGLPVAVVGEQIEQIEAESELFVDGEKGEVVVSPGEAERRTYQKFLAGRTKKQKERLVWAKRKGETKDGKRVYVLANLQTVEEWEEAKTAGAEGIGLFRSEFLAAGGSAFPLPETQREAYADILSKVAPLEVTVRAFDFGAEKVLGQEREENPALGLRGVRLLLQYPAILKSQLKALLEAAAFGRLKVMLPMVGSLEEFHSAKKFLSGSKKKIPLGIMVELPSAAILAEAFARAADFLSIGTNDLIQYTLGVDRSNPKVAGYYEPFHPAVLRLLAGIAAAGKKFKKPVSVCGQMAADPWGIFIFAGLGISELSVPVSALVETKKTLAQVDSKQATRTVIKILEFSTAEEVKAELKKTFPKGVR
ncbi:MAG: phosphoenolpyruvate--protein phosphotransferase [candidate division Zixibacteria bacterium]|nr:phosphoenolpyruvate--protein phosphotransferase [candidate division Zixibacteria bacterium]MCI0595294.1 phosphoenolpyruvate--protein phosphotransferase [candidate division Zixibacteria bacterium]